MRYLNLLALTAILLVGCQRDTVTEPANTANSALMVKTSQEYVPNAAFDNKLEGVYHGVIAAKSGTHSVKIWVNLNNNGRYSAKLIMTDGVEIKLHREKINSTDKKAFKFDNGQASFVVRYTDGEVTFTEAEIGGDPYLIHAPKQTSLRATYPFIGTYVFDAPTTYPGGTWTIFRDISQPDPNGFGFGGYAMADVVVVFDGNMYVDNSHETGPYPCEGAPNWIPNIRIVDFGGGQVINEMFVIEQQSTFIGATNWKIFQAGGIGYFDEDCNNLASGIFDWTHPTTNVVSTGTILVDINN